MEGIQEARAPRRAERAQGRKSSGSLWCPLYLPPSLSPTTQLPVAQVNSGKNVSESLDTSWGQRSETIEGVETYSLV